MTINILDGYNPRALQVPERLNAMFSRLSKPIRTVLRWQLYATAVLAPAAGLLAGGDGVLSALLGGLVSVLAGAVSGVVASGSTGQSPGGIVVAALTAEGVKIGLIVVLLWLVLALYKGVVVLAFFGTFMATVLIFAMAFFVREY